ncbi:MAG: hypothetical protein ACPGR2_13680 [Psychrobium sp.]
MKLQINDEISIKYNKDAVPAEAKYKISINNNILIHCDYLIIDLIESTAKKQAYYRLAGRSDQHWNLYAKFKLETINRAVNELRELNIKTIKGE